jgi:hypothetical protein
MSKSSNDVAFRLAPTGSGRTGAMTYFMSIPPQVESWLRNETDALETLAHAEIFPHVLCGMRAPRVLMARRCVRSGIGVKMGEMALRHNQRRRRSQRSRTTNLPARARITRW